MWRQSRASKVPPGVSDRYPCPHCGHRVLDEMPGSFDICPVCFWEDDGGQFRWPTAAGGANQVSFIEAQQNYQDFGACDEHGRQAVLRVPATVWTPAVEPDGMVRAGAWVAELAGDVLTGWPQGIRLVVRKERPHPGAQLRFTDVRHADHLLRNEHKRRPDRGPGTAAPPARPRRGPHPRSPRHRAAQPSLARHRPEPGLAERRPDRPRTAGLDADARCRAKPAGWNPNACGCDCSPPRHGSSPPAADAGSGWPATGPEPRPSPPCSTASKHRRPRLISNEAPPRRVASIRSSGTRHPPDATAGQPPRLPPAHSVETAHQASRRTVTKERG